MRDAAKRCGAKRRRSLGLAGALALAVAAPAPGVESGVTPARGPSLVARLRAGVDWTAFGRVGEGESAAAPTAHAAGRAPGAWLTEGFALAGADLYRLNCRACHGPDGKGGRSGIPPLWGAVEKAPVATGEPGGEIRVRHRLVEGGRVMPNFLHLTAEETSLLIGHLRTLGRPEVKTPASTLRQSALRVGEHVVKATCQICHDAVAGPDRMPADAQVPTLGEMTEKFAAAEFVRKTRAGSATVRGEPGRMPRFDYLATEELEAAYVFLIAFSPEPGPK
jgi:mono/diheme cytochrome c family protein